MGVDEIVELQKEMRFYLFFFVFVMIFRFLSVRASDSDLLLLGCIENRNYQGKVVYNGEQRGI